MLGVLAGCSIATDRALEHSARSFAANQWQATIPLCKRVLVKDPSRSMARYYLGLSYLHTFSPALAKGELELFLTDLAAGKELYAPAAAVRPGTAVSRRLLHARAMAGAGAANVMLGVIETTTDRGNRQRAAENFRTGRDLCRRAYGLAPADAQVRFIIENYVAPFGVINVPRSQHAADNANGQAASFILKPAVARGAEAQLIQPSGLTQKPQLTHRVSLRFCASPSN